MVCYCMVPVRRATDNVVAFAEGRSDGSLRLRLINLGINPIKQGDVFVTNKAVICDKAHIKGDVTAMVMEIREGAVIEGAIRKDVLHAPEEAPEEANSDTPTVETPEEDAQASTWF